MQLEMIVAQAANRVIGGNNEMLWHIPEDFKHFKKVTMGCPIIMGRKTHESIGRALPGRRNIIVTRNTDYQREGCDVVHSLEAALALVANEARVFIIGGGVLFREGLDKTQRIWLTQIEKDFVGDTTFPELNPADWTIEKIESLPPTPERDYAVDFYCYTRR